MASDPSLIAVEVLFLIMIVFTGGTLFLALQVKYAVLSHVPYTVGMFCHGILFGAVVSVILPSATEVLTSIPPRLVFHIFLPILIFEGSYGMKIHALHEVYTQVILLAGPGLLINTVFLALPAMLCFPQWSIYTALLLGSLLSATDPVAVVSLLKGLGVDKRITALVDGEAIMNDGTAIIAFSIFYPAAVAGVWTTPLISLVYSVFLFTVVAAVFGTFCGMMQAVVLRRTSNHMVQACVTISFTYVAYYIADVMIGTSPVLTMFFQGTYLSSRLPSMFPGSSATGTSLISSTWEFLVHLGNTVLFTLVGIIVWTLISFSAIDVVKIVFMFVVMTCGRALMILLLMPILNRGSFKLRFRDVIILTHGGLRGGVATVLALGLYQSPEFDQGEDTLKITAGVVGLTLLVNATTAAKLVDRLGLKKKPRNRHFQMQVAFNFVKLEGHRELSRARGDNSLKHADWPAVAQLIDQTVNPFEGTQCIEESKEVLYNRLMMTAFKSAVWRLRDEGSITEEAICALTEYSSSCLRRHTLFSTSELVRLYSLPPLWFRLLKRSVFAWPLSSWFKREEEAYQESFYLMLMSCVEALNTVCEVKEQYVSRMGHDDERIAQWIDSELDSLESVMELHGSKMTVARRKMSTFRAARRSLTAMDDAVLRLHDTHGLSVPLTISLREVVSNAAASASDLCSDPPDRDEVPSVVDELVLLHSNQGASPHDDAVNDADLCDKIEAAIEEYDMCVSALRSSLLGENLTDETRKVLLQHCHIQRLSEGEQWQQQSDSLVFLVVASGTVQDNWEVRSTSSVVYSAACLPFLTLPKHSEESNSTDVQQPQPKQAPTLSKKLSSSRLHAISDVTLMSFRFSDFIPAEMNESSAPHIPSSCATANRDYNPKDAVSTRPYQIDALVINLWKSIAAEALVTVIGQQRGNADVSAFDVANAASVCILRTNVEAEEWRRRLEDFSITTNVFFLFGEDTSQLYQPCGMPTPVPKSLLHSLEWKVGTVLVLLDLPGDTVGSGGHKLKEWMGIVDRLERTLTSSDTEFAARNQEEGAAVEETQPHLQRRNLGNIGPAFKSNHKALWEALFPDGALSVAFLDPVVNHLHLNLLDAIETVMILYCQLELQVGNVSLCRQLRNSTDYVIRLATEYCCRIQTLLATAPMTTLTSEQTSQFHAKRVDVESDNAPYLRINEARWGAQVLRLRSDVCTWLSHSYSPPAGEDARFPYVISKRLVAYLAQLKTLLP